MIRKVYRRRKLLVISIIIQDLTCMRRHSRAPSPCKLAQVVDSIAIIIIHSMSSK